MSLVSIRNCVDSSSPVAASWELCTLSFFFSNLETRTSVEADEVVVLSLLVSSARLLHILRIRADYYLAYP